MPASDPDATLDLPGLLADHLRTTGDETVRQALASGQTIRRGHGYSVRITAPLTLHRVALEQSAALAGRPDRAQGAPRVRRPCHSRSGHPTASLMSCDTAKPLNAALLTGLFVRILVVPRSAPPPPAG
ncbi:hypothetical protein GCM10023259_057270 [Thermocatellispora tengchongensis]